MKRGWKRLLALGLCLVFLAGLLPLSAAAERVDGGSDPDGTVFWSLDSEGTLTVSGSGAMSSLLEFRTPKRKDGGLRTGALMTPWEELKDQIGEVVVEPGITDIAQGAFNECPYLTRVTLPDSITEIAASAFSYCAALTEIVLPAGVTVIGDRSFCGCAALASVTFGPKLESIGHDAFFECKSLREVHIPAVKAIGEYAFWNCTSLERVTVETGLVSLGNGAFGDCSALTAVSLPGSLEGEMIIVEAFNGCRSLDSVYLPEYDLGSTPSNTLHLTQNLYRDGEVLVLVKDHVVERYSPDYQLLSSRLAERDLKYDRWGGFFAGEEYNFYIVGYNNIQEDKNKKVFTVYKYDKEFHLLDRLDLYGYNTQKPFEGGWAGGHLFDCTELDGVLYIHTCHTEFKFIDGNHQTNMTIMIRESDMSALSWGKTVSHSFDQYILADSEGYIVTLDKGDASPRAAVMRWGQYDWERTVILDGVEYYVKDTEDGELYIREFYGRLGNNETGCDIYGLEEIRDGLVTAYRYRDLDPAAAGADATYNLYFCYVPRELIEQSDDNDFTFENSVPIETRRLTDYGPDSLSKPGKVGLAPLGPEGGYVIWSVLEDGIFIDGHLATSKTAEELRYVRYYADGSLGEVRQAKGVFTGLCQPIAVDGKVLWYENDYYEKTHIFYTLDENGITAHEAVTQEKDDLHVRVGCDLVYWTDAAPFIDENSRTMVPLRAVADALGLTVSWDASAREAVFTDGTKTIYFPVGSSTARDGSGAEIQMDTATVIVNDRTYAPIRYLAEFFGHTVSWDGARRTVLIQ